MPKILCILLILFLSFGCAAQAVASPSIILDGKPVVFDSSPVIENNRLLVPLRPVLESIDATVTWNPEAQIVTVSKGTSQVNLTIGNSIANCNGQIIDIDAPARIIDGRTMVPLRLLSEAFGMTVNWIEFDKDNQIIVMRNPLIAYKTGLFHYTSRHTRWGQSLDEVMISEPTLPADSDENALLYLGVEFEGTTADMGYFFIGDKLAITMYDFHGEKQPAEESVRIYNQISNIMNSRYGAPVASIQNWRSKTFTDQDCWPGAVRSGDLTLLYAWMDEYTMICLFLNDNGKNLGMIYSDVERVDMTLISLLKHGLGSPESITPSL